MSDGRGVGTRKPYRISKPREKWTDKEHERFVNAINQHGRNWKRIVMEVGTRTVAQVRSHAQKYFLKLEKTGKEDDVPPARAKRPSAKPGTNKSSAEEGSSVSGQSSQAVEPKRPRRTERVSTKPVRSEFTFLEDDAAISPEPGSSTEEQAVVLAQEGKSSNDVDGSTESLQTSNRQSTAVSPLGQSYPSHRPPSIHSSNFHPSIYPDNTLGSDDLASPTDESSRGFIPRGAMDMDYNDLYPRSFHSENSHMLQNLGAAQRDQMPLVNNWASAEQLHPSHDSSSSPHPLEGDSHLSGNFASLGYHSGSATALHSSLHSNSPDLLPLEPVPDVPVTQANTQGTGLLPSCTQPCELDSSGWQLSGLSGDLNSLLASGSEFPYQRVPSVIDSQIFDY